MLLKYLLVHIYLYEEVVVAIFGTGIVFLSLECVAVRFLVSRALLHSKHCYWYVNYLMIVTWQELWSDN